MTALEARLRGAHQALTPVVDVAREPRWGRVEETYGEDPFLVSRMGIAAVRGFQGDRTFRDKQPRDRHAEALRRPRPAGVGHELRPGQRLRCACCARRFFTPSAKRCARPSAVSVMASYNEIDGVPSHANKWLLRDVLRKEMGFKGFIVSDYYAIWELGYRPDTHGHFVAKDKKESCALAVKAGVNIELPDPDCYLHLVELVKKGVLKESQLDELVAPMLFWKFEMGLFDDPYVDPDEAERVVGCEEHSQLALDRGARSHHAPEEREQPRPARSRQDQDHRRDRPQCRPHAARRLQRRPKARSHGARRHSREGRQARQGPLQRRLQDHHRRQLESGRSCRQRSRRRPPADCRGRQGGEARPTSSCSPSAATSRPRAKRGACKHMGDRTSLDLIGRQEELVEGHGRTRQAGHRVPLQRPAAFHQLPLHRMCR